MKVRPLSLRCINDMGKRIARHEEGWKNLASKGLSTPILALVMVVEVVAITPPINIQPGQKIPFHVSNAEVIAARIAGRGKILPKEKPCVEVASQATEVSSDSFTRTMFGTVTGTVSRTCTITNLVTVFRYIYGGWRW